MRRLLALGLWILLIACGAAGCSGDLEPEAPAPIDHRVRNDRSRNDLTTTTTTTTTAATGARLEALPVDAGAEDADAAAPTAAEPPERRPAVVFAPNGLPTDARERFESVEGVRRVAVIESAPLHLVASTDRSGRVVDQPDPGFVIPLDGIGIASAADAEVISTNMAEALLELPAGQVALSESSSELRRLGVGGSLTFADGTSVTVGAVLDDATAGTWEVLFVGVLPATGQRRQVAFVDTYLAAQDLEEAIDARLDVPFRVFGGADPQAANGSTAGSTAGTTPTRAILPTVAIKQRFGEFAYRPLEGRDVEIDPSWVEENIVLAELPLLGPARCHRDYAEMLTEVLQSLIDDGLQDTVDPAAFQGCWSPRFIGRSVRLSRHAWGVAADINFGNPLDDQPGSPVHPALVCRMAEVGITSGHGWTIPDPGHFEFIGSRGDEPPIEGC